jgi:thymidine phosphorylase
MDEPLGLAVGNGIELEQSIRILRGEKGPEDFMEVLEILSGWMIYLGAKAPTPEKGIAKARAVIADGSALEKMRLMVKWQGGDPRVVDHPEKFLPKAELMVEVKAYKAGYLTGMDARTVGHASVALGAGRARAEDSVDFGAGIRLYRKTGDKLAKGDLIARLYSSDSSKLWEGGKMFESSLRTGAKPPKKAPLIKEIIS